MIFNDPINLNGILQDIYFKSGIKSNSFNANDIKRIVNIYYRILQGEIRNLNENFFDVGANTSIVNGVWQKYAFPSDMERLKTIFVALSPKNVNSITRQDYQAGMVASNEQIDNFDYTKITDPVIALYGNYFELLNNVNIIGLPINNVGIRIVYTPVQSDLSADTDTPNIPTDYHDIISWGSIIDIADNTRDINLLKKAQGMYKERLTQMRNDISNRVTNMAGFEVEGQNGGSGALIPQWGGSIR